MQVAFYAPLKSPDHPQPSGDRRMARAFMALLAGLGHEVALASTLRTYDRNGDLGRQARLERIGARQADRLLRRWEKRLEPTPDLWFTYHLYHKAPDPLGPSVSRALGIPYLVAEASFSPRQAAGPWAHGHAASQAAIAGADRVLAMTRKDQAGLAAIVPDERLVRFPPFLDAAPFVAASRRRQALRAGLARAWRLDPNVPWLLAVAMMRTDVKLLSYRLLAEALAGLVDRPWQLLVVGDGEGRGEVLRSLAPLGPDRCRFPGVAAPAAMPGIHAAADLHVWPACNEAYGMALLEAQAAGVPVVAGAEGGVADIVAHERTGLLVEPRRPEALAAAVRALLAAPERRLAMARAAQRHVLTGHDTGIATARLAAVLAPFARRPHPAPSWSRSCGSA